MTAGCTLAISAQGEPHNEFNSPSCHHQEPGLERQTAVGICPSGNGMFTRREIILVDSPSTDDTVELACAYPIDVSATASGPALDRGGLTGTWG